MDKLVDQIRRLLLALVLVMIVMVTVPVINGSSTAVFVEPWSLNLSVSRVFLKTEEALVLAIRDYLVEKWIAKVFWVGVSGSLMLGRCLDFRGF